MKKKNKIKEGDFYSIFDYSCLIEIDYGISVYLGESIETRWHDTNKKTKEKIYKDCISLNFYSLLRNEKFYIYEDDFLHAHSGYAIKKI